MTPAREAAEKIAAELDHDRSADEVARFERIVLEAIERARNDLKVAVNAAADRGERFRCG